MAVISRGIFSMFILGFERSSYAILILFFIQGLHGGPCGKFIDSYNFPDKILEHHIYLVTNNL